MPTIPSIQTLKNNTPNILNAIRNDLGGTYADLIPMANNTSDSIRSIGQAVMSNELHQNSFLNALMNRIGMTIITSKSYTNPWAIFKRGMLDFGETIEEIYVSMATPYQYDPEDAEQTLYKQYQPDVQSAFHTLNFAKQYPQTIKEEQLRQAFLSMNGVTDLISKITQAMYTGMEYDEFIVMKFMLARIALKGKITPINIPIINKDNMLDIVSKIKETSGNLKYMSPNYNMAHVQNQTEVGEQYIILSNNFDSKMDVQVLASAFNIDKADFIGQRVGVDSFGIVDSDRLAILFAKDNSYVPLTAPELSQLDAIPAMIVDKEFFMIFDNLLTMRDVPNGKGLYWNYFLHVWKTFSVSPFANAVLFTTLTPGITSIDVTPATATGSNGVRMVLSASVVSTGFGNNEVRWSVDSEFSTITPDGQLTIAQDETAGTLTVTATSVFDESKLDTAIITVA